MRWHTNVLLLLVFIISIIFTPITLAEESIDPYNYELILGQVDNLQGEVMLIKEDGTNVKLKNNEYINSQQIKRFMLIYSDNAQTLIDGRKELKEDLKIRTGPNGELQILLSSTDKDKNYLLVGPNAEIDFTISGGCCYMTEHDGEGYDKSTLKWRHIKKDITWRLISGNVKVLVQKNDEFRLGSPTTENAHIHIDTGNEISEYEVNVLKGDKAVQEDVKVASLTPEMNAQIEAIKNNYLLVYKVDSIEKLPPEIKNQLDEQIKAFKESYQQAENTMNEMMDQTRQIVTILKIYQGKAKLEDTDLKSGEMAKVKGDIQRASTPTKI